MAARLPITKTPKVYVGGAFIRSESGRVFRAARRTREFLREHPAMHAQGSAQCRRGRGEGRAGLGETHGLQPRADPLPARRDDRGAQRGNGARRSRSAARAKPTPRGKSTASIDRLIHYAGWADKYEQLLGNVNPVASPHFNFTVTEPMGIVGVIAPDEAPLLALVSLFAPAITSGNMVVALASQAQPYPAILLGEMLATSDLPGGVVNLLTGLRSELIPTFATHEHIRAISGLANAADRERLKLGAAESVKRVRLHKAEESVDWFADDAQGLYEIRELIEFKTTWHPIGA